MIIINCRFDVRPELADRWLDITAELTSGSRAEEAGVFPSISPRR